MTKNRTLSHEKQCTKCGAEKPTDQFRPWPARKGYASRCKDCERAYRANPENRIRRNTRDRERLADPEKRIRELARGAHRRAKRRGLAFDNDISDLLPPPTHCPALGIPIDYSVGKGQRKTSPSIDRIDNTRGYVKGNRVVVSLRANERKSDLSVADLCRMADFYKRLARDND